MTHHIFMPWPDLGIVPRLRSGLSPNNSNKRDIERRIVAFMQGIKGVAAIPGIPFGTKRKRKKVRRSERRSDWEKFQDSYRMVETSSNALVTQHGVEKSKIAVKCYAGGRWLERVAEGDTLIINAHGGLMPPVIGISHPVGFNPTELAFLLQKEGLPNVRLKIKVFACHSGERSCIENSFAEQLQRALFVRGYRHIEVRGYHGLARWADPQRDQRTLDRFLRGNFTHLSGAPRTPIAPGAIGRKQVRVMHKGKKIWRRAKDASQDFPPPGRFPFSGVRVNNLPRERTSSVDDRNDTLSVTGRKRDRASYELEQDQEVVQGPRRKKRKTTNSRIDVEDKKRSYRAPSI